MKSYILKSNTEAPNMERRNSCKAKIQTHEESVESTKSAKMCRNKENGNTKRRNSLGGNIVILDF